MNNVPFETVPPVVVPPVTPQIDYKKLYEESQKTVVSLQTQLKTCEGQVNSLKQTLNEIKVLAS